ncbi:phosphatidate cytidylyltransferase [Massilia sp. W12]|uniref:phosphatidate cytidylyltransferase n=1 Tax=Massilia sp. W12 TaxID=3126507 RepID=UPI0030D47DA3
MLGTRILTAIVLLALILPALFSGYYAAFALLAFVFYAAAIWESQRLFFSPRPKLQIGIWCFAYALVLGIPQPAGEKFGGVSILFALACGIWALRLSPKLNLGLPPADSLANRLLSNIYNLSLLCCFIALAYLQQRSPVYLVSAMALVWVADIGAYFSGRTFGRRKLAPSISPGKSWEGAIGGALMVLALSSAVVLAAPSYPWMHDTFVVYLQARWGWLALIPALLLICAASVVGDLFESMLKRRAEMKDSSNLLPGHGGVLDRIDALIPVLPLVGLFDFMLRQPA